MGAAAVRAVGGSTMGHDLLTRGEGIHVHVHVRDKHVHSFSTLGCSATNAGVREGQATLGGLPLVVVLPWFVGGRVRVLHAAAC